MSAESASALNSQSPTPGRETPSPTRRKLLMASPGRKTGISISPSRLDPNLTNSPDLENQRALVRKMEMLVGEHHYRSASGVQSQLGNHSFGFGFQPKTQTTNPKTSQDKFTPLSALDDSTELHYWSAPQSATLIESARSTPRKCISRGGEFAETSPRFDSLSCQAEDGNQFYKRLFDKLGQRPPRKKSPYGRTSNAVRKHVQPLVEPQPEIVIQDLTTPKIEKPPVPEEQELPQAQELSLEQTAAQFLSDRGPSSSIMSDLNMDEGGQLPKNRSSRKTNKSLNVSMEGDYPELGTACLKIFPCPNSGGKPIKLKNCKKFKTKRGLKEPPHSPQPIMFADLSSSIEIQAPLPSMESSVEYSFEESQIMTDDEKKKSSKSKIDPNTLPRNFETFKSHLKKNSVSQRKADKKPPKTNGWKYSYKNEKKQKYSKDKKYNSDRHEQNKRETNMFGVKRGSEGQLEKSGSVTKLFLEGTNSGCDTPTACSSTRSGRESPDFFTNPPAPRGRQQEEKKCSTFKKKKHNFPASSSREKNIHFALFKNESNVKYGCIPLEKKVITSPERAFRSFVSSLEEDRPSSECGGQMTPISKSLVEMLAKQKSISSPATPAPQRELAPRMVSDDEDEEFEMMQSLSKTNSYKAIKKVIEKPSTFKEEKKEEKKEENKEKLVKVPQVKISPLELPFSGPPSAIIDSASKEPSRQISGYSFGGYDFGVDDSEVLETPRLSTEQGMTIQSPSTKLSIQTPPPAIRQVEPINIKTIERPKIYEIENQEKNIQFDKAVEKITRKHSSGKQVSRANILPQELSFGLPLFLNSLKSEEASLIEQKVIDSCKISIYTEPAKVVYEIAKSDGHLSLGNHKEEIKSELPIESTVGSPREVVEDEIKAQRSASAQKLHRAGDKLKQLKTKLTSGQISAFYKLQQEAAKIIQQNYRQCVNRRKMLYSLHRLALTGRRLKEMNTAFPVAKEAELKVCRSIETQTDGGKSIGVMDAMYLSSLVHRFMVSAFMVTRAQQYLLAKIN